MCWQHGLEDLVCVVDLKAVARLFQEFDCGHSLCMRLRVHVTA